jgi:hypothetical protein
LEEGNGAGGWKGRTLRKSDELVKTAVKDALSLNFYDAFLTKQVV